MRVLLVETAIPGGLGLAKGGYYPRGVAQVATVAHQAGHQVEVVPEAIRPVRDDEIAGADLVGVSSLTCGIQRGYEIIDRANELGKFTAIGGSHVSFEVEEGLAHADYIIRSAGEEAFPSLLDALENRRPLENVPNLCWKGDGQIRQNSVSPVNLNDYSMMPNFELFKDFKPVTLPVVTSLGCFRRCKFCTIPRLWGNPTFKDPQPLGEALEKAVKKYKPKSLFIADDSFGEEFQSTREHAKQVLKEWIRRGIKIFGVVQLPVAAAKDLELLELLNKASFRIVLLGLESVNPKTLISYRKKQTLKEMKEAIFRFKEYKLHPYGMFVFGGEEDTPETLCQTEEFAEKEVKLDGLHCAIKTPFPGTDDRDEMESQGRILTKNWRLYDATFCVFRHKSMTPEEIEKGVLKVMTKFSSWPRIIKAFFRGELISVGMRLYLRKALKDISKFTKNLRESSYQSIK